MANWVVNEVTIRAKNDTIKDIKRFVKSDESVFDFNKIMPEPPNMMHTTHDMIKLSKYVRKHNLTIEEIDKLDYNYHNSNFEDVDVDVYVPLIHWHEWRTGNWEVKWNATYAKIINKGQEFISYRFETPWYYPDRVYTVLSKLFPDAEIEVSIEEEGCQFAAVVQYRNGVQTEYTDVTYERRKELIIEGEIED